MNWDIITCERSKKFYKDFIMCIPFVLLSGLVCLGLNVVMFHWLYWMTYKWYFYLFFNPKVLFTISSMLIVFYFFFKAISNSDDVSYIGTTKFENNTDYDYWKKKKEDGINGTN